MTKNPASDNTAAQQIPTQQTAPKQAPAPSTLGLRSLAGAWFRSTHPGPSLTVAVLSGYFAAMSGAPLTGVVLVTVAMLANQFGIGLGNDWLDSARDQQSKRLDKPIASGVIPRRSAGIVAVLLGVLALALSALLGPVAVGVQGVMLAAGWWYNLHAKFHWSSPLSYLLGFGLLPVFALTAHPGNPLPEAWIVVVAGALGLSAHFANALPDLLDDTVQGIRGLPQIVGARISGVVVLAGVVVATSVIAVFATGTPALIRLATVALAVGLSVWAVMLAFRESPPRIIFPVVMLVAGVCVVGLGFSL